MKSLKMHMLYKHSKTNDTETDDTTDSTEVTPAKNDATSTSDNNDSDEVTSANNDDTPSTPDPTTNTPTNPTIPNYQTIMDRIDKYCIHFQKGTCKFGENCSKIHVPPSSITCPKCGDISMTLGQFKYHMTRIHDPNKNIQDPP